jgi:hypothetical protein
MSEKFILLNEGQTLMSISEIGLTTRLTNKGVVDNMTTIYRKGSFSDNYTVSETPEEIKELIDDKLLVSGCCDSPLFSYYKEVALMEETIYQGICKNCGYKTSESESLNSVVNEFINTKKYKGA